VLNNTLKHSVSTLGSQIEALFQANSALEKRFSDLVNTQSQSQKISKPLELSSAAAASSIADELPE